MFPEGRLLEFMLAGIVALIVVGPKDLPVLLRKLGQFMARVRAMAAEFRASFDEMARQSELDELRKEVEAMRKGQFGDVAGTSEMTQTFEDISQGLSDVGVQLNQPVSYPYVSTETAVEMQPLAKVRKPRAKKPAAPKAVAKTPAAKTPAAKTPAAKTSVAKTSVAKAPAAKSIGRKPTAAKPAARPAARARKSAKTDA